MFAAAASFAGRCCVLHGRITCELLSPFLHFARFFYYYIISYSFDVQVHELLSDTSDLYSELVMRSFAVCRLQLQLLEQHDASLQEDLDSVRRAIATDTVSIVNQQCECGAFLMCRLQVLHASSLQFLRFLVVTCDVGSIFLTQTCEMLAGLMNLIISDLVMEKTGLHLLDNEAPLYVSIRHSLFTFMFHTITI